jgi:hypothetical protein
MVGSNATKPPATTIPLSGMREFNDPVTGSFTFSMSAFECLAVRIAQKKSKKTKTPKAGQKNTSLIHSLRGSGIAVARSQQVESPPRPKGIVNKDGRIRARFSFTILAGLRPLLIP